MGIALEAALPACDRARGLRYDIAPVEEHRDRAALREASDLALVSTARTGGFAAFEELVRRYRNDVFRLCCHFTRNREEAWDLSQETFIKAYNGLAHFRGEAEFKTWLLRIAANQCKDFLKRHRIPTVGLDETRAESAPSARLEPDHAVEAEEIGRAIDSAVQALPVKHRTAFILREFEDMSYDEMARVMNCTLGTVMSRLHHARKKLQQRLCALGISPKDAAREGNPHV